MTTLLTRQGIASGERTIEDFYVQPQLVVELAAYRLRDVSALSSHDLTRGLTRDDLQEFRYVLKVWGEALQLAGIWALVLILLRNT